MIEQIFLQPHIFVVFQQGAGGNFLCALIRNLLQKNTESLIITDRGSAHPEVDLKILGKDYLAFGTLPDDQLQFTTSTQREEFYLRHIKKNYNDIDTPQVVWTHDYSNIQLYQKYFPNSKVLVVTQESAKEKLSLTVMNVLKTLLGPGSKGPFPPTQWENIKKRWRHLIKKDIGSFLQINIDDEKLETIKENYFDIYKYSAIKTRLEYFRLYPLSETDHQLDVVNNSLFNLNTNLWVQNDKLPIYTVGVTHQSYINERCIKLPFDYVLTSNLKSLVDCLEKVLGKLNHSQLAYVKHCFDTYISKQERLLLRDPILYVKDLEQAADNNRQIFLRNQNEN